MEQRDEDDVVMIGHEFCAEVLGYGPQTEQRIPVGARVVSMPLLAVGGTTETIGLSSNVPGGFSDRMLLDERLILPVPKEVPTIHAALVEPIAVSLRAVAAADVQPGDVALVLGCGPVGCTVIVSLKRAGIPVVASDPSPARRSAAVRLGADVVVDPRVEAPVDQLLRLGGQDLPYSPALPRDVRRSNTVIFECVGAPGMLQHMVETAPGHARMVCVGVCHQPDTFVPSVAFKKELSLTFAFAYRPEEFAQALAAICAGEVDVDGFVTGVFPLAEVNTAFAELRQPEMHLKVLIQP